MSSVTPANRIRNVPCAVDVTVRWCGPFAWAATATRSPGRKSVPRTLSGVSASPSGATLTLGDSGFLGTAMILVTASDGAIATYTALGGTAKPTAIYSIQNQDNYGLRIRVHRDIVP